MFSLCSRSPFSTCILDIFSAENRSFARSFPEPVRRGKKGALFASIIEISAQTYLVGVVSFFSTYEKNSLHTIRILVIDQKKERNAMKKSVVYRRRETSRLLHARENFGFECHSSEKRQRFIFFEERTCGRNWLN